jgi:Ca-activated chloride channel family protein
MILNRWFCRSLRRFWLWLALGLSLTLVGGCFLIGGGIPSVDSTEAAERVLLDTVLPGVDLQEDFVDDGVALGYATDSISEPLPSIDEFPLYGATPSNDGSTVYVEIYSSSEKANIDKQNERWLIEVADAFNQQGNTVGGRPIQVGIRQIPSGTAARLLVAGQVQPTGYSPSNDLWVQMLASQGVTTQPVAARLVPNAAGFVLQQAAYEQLGGDVGFEQVLDAMISGQLTAGYPNPYTSSTSLNLLYSLFWRAAGRQADRQPLTLGDLESPEVNSVFSAFNSRC